MYDGTIYKKLIKICVTYLEIKYYTSLDMSNIERRKFEWNKF